ncbi:bifunctional pyr operon transcriptional regulator/uracil phosphoribosyltransferase PyrR [Allohahella sp. A8]|uniref:bifunctional pyr operon transcriptional regulator/uracil phosphoribosyltransferase PyrR n=1 Tax=Allohahella sp. A8 TaxID=3141461 RepID=UPI000C0AE9C8|nr:bifunctional pyr operon transcriptional regulator/uracil phosphoribosyltransferase [Hahellaceae bacterium]|tara:strand:+ start:62216 stop:62839 length:624 start_codon:yes stop_codon:yes gene_type:complete
MSQSIPEPAYIEPSSIEPDNVANYDVADGVARLDTALRQLLAERSIALADTLLVGIRTGGLWVAEALANHAGLSSELADAHTGALNIAFYRDDFTRIGLHPKVTPSSLPFSIDDRHILLVDDVIRSGRTIRAAMNELFDFGRPASITLVCLCDAGQRELPVQPDLAAMRVRLPDSRRVKLRKDPDLRLEIVGPHVDSAPQSEPSRNQ